MGDPNVKEKTEVNNRNSGGETEINGLGPNGNTEMNNPNLKEKIYPILEKETESIDRILEEKTRIYCCHLVNEKDRKYTIFGIEEILDGIKNLFSPQIEKIKKFEEDLKKPTEEININKNFKHNKNIENETAEQPLNILRSLEKSNSFVEYLKKLSMNICNKYDKKITEIEKNKFNLDLKIETLENILKGLKEHLAFELDIDPSKFDVSSNSQANHSSKNNNQNQYSISNFWFSKSNEDKKKQDKIDSLQSKIEKIKEIIGGELEKNKDNINPYMREVIHNYEEAIKSLEEIKKFKIKREF